MRTRAPGFWLLVGALAASLTCGDAGSAPAAAPEPASAEAALVAPDEPVRVIALEVGTGSSTLTQGFTLADAASNGIVASRTTSDGSRLTRLVLDARDGTIYTIEVDARGRPAAVSESAGSTALLDWANWEAGRLVVRSGATRAAAEASAAAPVPLTAEQRARIEALIRQLRVAQDAAPVTTHPASFTTADAVSIPLSTLIARDITLLDAQGRNVSAGARVTRVECSPPVTCQYQSGSNARYVQLNVPLAVSVPVAREGEWTRVRDACAANQNRWGNWLEHATTAGLILAAVLNPESWPVFAAVGGYGPQVGKSVNLLRDCDRVADTTLGQRAVAAMSLATTLKYCVATSDRPPLIQCHDERVSLGTDLGRLNLRALTLTLPVPGVATSPTATRNAATPTPNARPTATRTPTPASTATPAPVRTAAPTTTPAPTRTPAPTPAPPPPPPVLGGVTAPSQLKWGATGTTTVTWSGPLLAPARVSWIPVKCDFDCDFGSTTITAPQAGSITIPGAPSCTRFPLPSVNGTFTYDISLVDGQGRRSANQRITWVCTP